MKRIFSLFAMIFFISLFLVIFAESTKTSTGFYWPTGTSQLGNFAKFLAAGSEEYFDGYYHTGYDIRADKDDNVFAICDGDRIGDPTSGGWGDGNVGLVVKHQLANGTIFYAIYGHLQEDSIPFDKKIKAGQVIGKIGFWTYGNHLHFGICVSEDAPKTNLGMASLPENWNGDKHTLDTKNFVDPINFIKTQKPKNPLQINIEVPKPIFEKPIKLPNTGMESMPSYANCKLSAIWDTGKAIGAHSNQIFYMAMDSKNHLWVAGESGFVIFDQNGNNLGYFTSLNIYNSNFGLKRVYAISVCQEKAVMIANLSYNNQYYGKLLRFDLSTNPFSIFYNGTEDECGKEQGKFFGFGFGIYSAIHPITGDIYIIDRTSSGNLETSSGDAKTRLQKFSSNGIFQWAKNVDSYLTFPIGAVFDKQGNLIVADNNLATIAEFDSNGNLVGKYFLPKNRSGNIPSPNTMCIDKFGRVIVERGGAGITDPELQIFSNNMSQINGYRLPFIGSIGISDMAIDSEGNLYFGSRDGDVYKVIP